MKTSHKGAGKIGNWMAGLGVIGLVVIVGLTDTSGAVIGPTTAQRALIVVLAIGIVGLLLYVMYGDKAEASNEIEPPATSGWQLDEE
ncbi:hypothetical protein KW803_01180 [Candidatus Saccharibacteria bacterium]|nr:hypothetical protein [Candidatus Saccharibacteria bacterium]